MSSKNYTLLKIKAFIGDDDMVMDKMIDIFLTNTPTMISKIEEGLAKEDYEQINFHAHKLKSSIDNFCIIQLLEDIRLIEKIAKEKQALDRLPALIQKLKTVLESVMEEIKNDFNKS